MKELLKIGSVVSIVFGVILVVAGIWGIVFVYRKIAEEKIVTPADSILAQKAVRGPLTLSAQADIIREHVLKMTNGKTFAEMPREIPKLSTDGKPLLDQNGKPIMIENAGRNVWITATTLTTALNLAMLTYALCAFVIVCGLLFGGIGIVFYLLSQHFNFV